MKITEIKITIKLMEHTQDNQIHKSKTDGSKTDVMDQI